MVNFYLNARGYQNPNPLNSVVSEKNISFCRSKIMRQNELYT